MLNFLKAMDNVLVVGSNSAGFQLCGNVRGYSLPNSGVYFDFGTSLQFAFTTDNVDFVGYEPDVWCDPAYALEAALNLTLRYGLVDLAPGRRSATRYTPWRPGKGYKKAGHSR